MLSRFSCQIKAQPKPCTRTVPFAFFLNMVGSMLVLDFILLSYLKKTATAYYISFIKHLTQTTFSEHVSANSADFRQRNVPKTYSAQCMFVANKLNKQRALSSHFVHASHRQEHTHKQTVSSVPNKGRVH